MKRLLLLPLLLLAIGTFAQIPKAKKHTYVNDYSNSLSAADVEALNKKIYVIEKKNGAQLAIVLVNKVPAKYTIKQFANAIGQKWHVGKKNQKGIVYVGAIAQHKQQLVVAKSLNTLFTTEVSDAILIDMKPAYKSEDYAGGLNILVDGIQKTFAPDGEVVENEPVQASTATHIAAAPGQNNLHVFFWIGLFTAIIIFIVLYRRAKRRQSMLEYENWLLRQGPNNGANVAGNRNSGYGYGAPGNYPPQPPPRSGFGSFFRGAAFGAAGGYAARYFQDRFNRERNNFTSGSPYADNASDDDNQPSNWGNWGSGGSSYSSSDSGSSSSDSGFSSDSSGGSSSGGSTDW